MTSKLTFKNQPLWNSQWKTDTLLIFDQNLLKIPAIRTWIQRFPVRYGVKAGEDLKDIKAFPQHMIRISRLSGEMASRRLTLVVAGGGSVGDFGGFVASVFKRGVRLIHVPTTWLAAMDSAHGGKTGLNVEAAKNQVGTFYPAHEVLIVKSFLMSQPRERAVEATGEALKMMLLKGSSVLPSKFNLQNPGESLWKALPDLIRGKLSIVKKDPEERRGLRQLLNLGHTLGHVMEVEKKFPHGLAVTYGLIFALIFSRARGVLSDKELEKIFSHPAWTLFLPSYLHQESLQLSSARLKSLLLKDKKRTRAQSLRFVLVKKLGQPLLAEVRVDELIKEVERQKARVKIAYG